MVTSMRIRIKKDKQKRQKTTSMLVTAHQGNVRNMEN
jgi:hypothetical protein